jgi:hypothetical protein
MNTNTTNENEQEKQPIQHTGLKYKVDQNGIVYIVDSFYTDVLNNK